MSILYAPSIIKPSRTLITPDTCVNYKHPLADKIVIYNPCLPPNAWIDCAKPYNDFLVPYSNAYWPFQKYAYGADGVVSNGYYGVVQYQIGDIISSETTAFFNQESYSILWTFSVGATTSLIRVGLGYNVSSSTYIGIGFNTSSYLLAGASDGFGTNISVTSSLIPKILQTYTAVATFKKGGYLRLYIDGEEVGTAATASFKLATSCRNIMMGNLTAGYATMSPCRHKLAIYWNGRELSAEEVRDITADPYQVLEPPKTLFYFTVGGGATSLVVADCADAVSSDSPTLVQQHTLISVDGTHISSSDSPTLAQQHVLVAADGSHVVSSDVPELIVEGTLEVADAVNVLTSDAPTLTQNHILVVEDASHTASSDVPTLVQQHQLTIDNSINIITSDEVTLDVSTQLEVADSGHAVASDTPTLTQVHTLVVADGINVITSDVPTLVQNITLVVADATDVVTSDEVSLSSLVELIVADGGSAVVSDVVDLITSFGVSDSSHVVTSDSPTLVQQHILAVADSYLAVTSDNISSFTAKLLVVNDSYLIVTSDVVTLLTPTGASGRAKTKLMASSSRNILQVADTYCSFRSANSRVELGR